MPPARDQALLPALGDAAGPGVEKFPQMVYNSLISFALNGNSLSRAPVGEENRQGK